MELNAGLEVPGYGYANIALPIPFGTDVFSTSVTKFPHTDYLYVLTAAVYTKHSSFLYNED